MVIVLGAKNKSRDLFKILHPRIDIFTLIEMNALLLRDTWWTVTMIMSCTSFLLLLAVEALLLLTKGLNYPDTSVVE